MSVKSEKSDYARRPICLLKEFVECYPYPQMTRLAQDYRVDIPGGKSFTLRRGTTVTIHNKASGSVNLSCVDPWSLTLERQLFFSMSASARHRFRLLPYDPATSNRQPEQVYETVRDLVRVWPVEVVVGQEIFFYDSPAKKPMLSTGDRIKLTRRVWYNNERYLECRCLPYPGVCLLPMDVCGKFRAMESDRQYTFAELLTLPSRRRRLQLMPNPLGKLPNIPDLPQGFSDDLYLEERAVCAECSTPSLPGLNFELSANIRVYLPQSASSSDTITRGHQLKQFCVSNRFIFPLVVQVTDWDEETNVLENSGVRPGSTLIFHEIQDAEKVLGKVKDKHYAIPLNYAGKFSRPMIRFKTVAEVVNARNYSMLKVVGIHPALKCPLKIGDIIRRSSEKGSFKRSNTVKFDKVEITSTKTKTKQVKLELDAPITMEEVRQSGSAGNSDTLKDFIPLMNKEEIVISLDESRVEQKYKDRDLPLKEPLTLLDLVKESMVVVSWENVNSARFTIPLRTEIYVKFISQANDKTVKMDMSPAVNCVELLSDITFTNLRQRRDDLVLPPERYVTLR